MEKAGERQEKQQGRHQGHMSPKEDIMKHGPQAGAHPQ